MGPLVRLLERRFTVEAPLERAWRHLEKVEHWPTWARHIRRIDLMPSGRLTSTSAGALVLTNGIRSTFRMEELIAGANWKWAGRFLWITVHYDHQFRRAGPEHTEIGFVLDGEGVGASVFGRLFASLYARNLDRAIPNLIQEIERDQASPPAGFRSRQTFEPGDMAARLSAVPWFRACGQGPVEVEVTPEVVWVHDSKAAAEAARSPEWDDAMLEAQNQLTLWLHLHARAAYQTWNDRVAYVKATLLAPLEATWSVHRPGLGDGVIQSTRWNILSAAMENEYLPEGHSTFFFLELLRIYEAGHVPCGWEGHWPEGKLLVH